MDLHETEYTNQTFKNLDMQEQEIRSKTFEDCTFVKCSFQGTTFRACKFLHCTFKDCNWSLVKVTNSSFRTTKFEDSKVVGVNWTEATWGKPQLPDCLDFVNCTLNYCTFLGLYLRKIHITKCIAKDVDFAEADLTQANCAGTDFTDSRFLHTNLTEADFTGAKNYRIVAGLNTIKKAKFALPEAVSLLYGLDITIVDEE
jgi:uncharacterized protein YjbI with pentapeptide repeats